MQSRASGAMEQLWGMTLTGSGLSRGHPPGQQPGTAIAWGCKHKTAPRTREGIVPSTLCSSDLIRNITLHAGKTATNWLEVSRSHQGSGTGALALRGEAAGPGLVQPGGGMASGPPNGIDSTDARGWRKEMQPGSSQQCVEEGG